MSLRGPVTTSTPRGREAAEFDAMGWDGVGWDGQQKFPLNFFILYGNIKHIYIYILVYKIKIVTNILMGFKI